MTKFTDRLENDLEQIADQATPSSNAWQAIQDRMAEPVTNDAREVIMLTDEREIAEEVAEGRRRSWLAVAAAVVLVAVAAGAIFGTRGSDEVDVTDQSTTEDTIEESVEETPATTATTPTTTIDEPEQAIEATPIIPGLPLEAGLVESEMLGESVRMELPEDMFVAYARPGEIGLVDDQEDTTEYLVMARVGGWYSGTEAIDSTYLGEGSIDARDPQAWIDDNGVIGERRPDLEVSGRTAMIWDISVDPAFEGSLYDDCPQCMLTYSVPSEFFNIALAQSSSRFIISEEIWRMYFFEGVEGADPLVFFAVSILGDTSFIDEFEETIFPTIQFEPAP